MVFCTMQQRGFLLQDKHQVTYVPLILEELQSPWPGTERLRITLSSAGQVQHSICSQGRQVGCSRRQALGLGRRPR